MTESDRFWARVTKEPGDGCWLWQGAPGDDGYGEVTFAGRKWYVHRWVWTALIGPIAEGLTIDHLCRVRLCVRPSHLEPVTNRENILRGESPAAAHARQTHCIHGHPLSGDNLVRPRRGGRQCRECRRVGLRRFRAGAIGADPGA